MNTKRIFLFMMAALPSLFVYSQNMNDAPAAPSANAQGTESIPDISPTAEAAISPKTQNGVTYSCGGVGVAEQEKMKLEAPNYDLMLTFAARDAGYLADVDVRITDENGAQVLKTFCGAPMLLVQFPRTGRYDVHAETGGYTLDKKISIKKHPETTASVMMLWPQQIAEAVTPATTSSGDSGTAGASGAGGGNEEEGGDSWTPALHGGE